MKTELIDKSVDPRARKLVLECVGRLRGRFLYSEEEAIDTVRAVLATPISPPKNNSYQYTADLKGKPWKPGDPKPTRAEQT